MIVLFRKEPYIWSLYWMKAPLYLSIANNRKTHELYEFPRHKWCQQYWRFFSWKEPYILSIHLMKLPLYLSFIYNRKSREPYEVPGQKWWQRYYKIFYMKRDLCKQGDVEISNFPISLRIGLVIDVSFCVSSRVAAVPLGGGITVCDILMTPYRPVPTSRTTNTRKFMGSYSQGVCTLSQLSLCTYNPDHSLYNDFSIHVQYFSPNGTSIFLLCWFTK